jgi:hypothetical protein
LERADATGRRGVIEVVLQEQPLRYQVRWEDGRAVGHLRPFQAHEVSCLASKRLGKLERVSPAAIISEANVCGRSGNSMRAKRRPGFAFQVEKAVAALEHDSGGYGIERA